MLRRVGGCPTYDTGAFGQALETVRQQLQMPLTVERQNDGIDWFSTASLAIFPGEVILQYENALHFLRVIRHVLAQDHRDSVRRE